MSKPLVAAPASFRARCFANKFPVVSSPQFNPADHLTVQGSIDYRQCCSWPSFAHPPPFLLQQHPLLPSLRSPSFHFLPNLIKVKHFPAREQDPPHPTAFWDLFSLPFGGIPSLSPSSHFLLSYFDSFHPRLTPLAQEQSRWLWSSCLHRSTFL